MPSSFLRLASSISFDDCREDILFLDTYIYTWTINDPGESVWFSSVSFFEGVVVVFIIRALTHVDVCVLRNGNVYYFFLWIGNGKAF